MIQTNINPFCFVGIGNCDHGLLINQTNESTETETEYRSLTIDKNAILTSNEQMKKIIIDTFIDSSKDCYDFSVAAIATNANSNLNYLCVSAKVNTIRDEILIGIINRLIIYLRNSPTSDQKILINLGIISNSQTNSDFLLIANSPNIKEFNVVTKNRYNLLKNYQKNIVNTVAIIVLKNITTNFINNCIKYLSTKNNENNNISNAISKYIDQDGLIDRITQDFLDVYGIKIIDNANANANTSENQVTSMSTNINSSDTDESLDMQDIYIPIITFIIVLLFLIICGLCAWSANKLIKISHEKQ
jgi:hypothetical protein